MPKTPFRTGRTGADQRNLERLTRAQIMRQVGVILVVLVLWSALLAGYLQITGEPQKHTVIELLEPTVVPTEPTLEAEAPQPEKRPTEPATSEPTIQVTLLPTSIATPPPEEPSSTPAPSATLPPTVVAGDPVVSFSREVLPILESRCVQCHGSSRTEGGLLLDSYPAVMSGSNDGPVLVPGDSAQSILVELIVSGQMPRRGPGLTPNEIEIITAWVENGALEN